MVTWDKWKMMKGEQLVAKQEQLRGMRPTPFPFFTLCLCVCVCVNFKFLLRGSCEFRRCLCVDRDTWVVILCYPIFRLLQLLWVLLCNIFLILKWPKYSSFLLVEFSIFNWPQYSYVFFLLMPNTQRILCHTYVLFVLYYT